VVMDWASWRLAAAKRLAAPMFAASAAFLAIVAVSLQPFVSVLHVGGGHGLDPVMARQVKLGVMILWPLFWLELLWILISSERDEKPFWKRHAWEAMACLVPPLRMALPCRAMQGRLWLPGLGWCVVDDDLRATLERRISPVMFVVAILIVPILLIEFNYPDLLREHLDLAVALDLLTCFIWFAFTAEFIVMVSVAEKKLDYCKRHWIDLAIILLPLLAFARSLRLVRAMRVLRVSRMSQLTRLYRLRALASKGFRVLLALELLERMMYRNPENRLKALQRQRADLMKEVDSLDERIDRVQQQIREREQQQAAGEQVKADDAAQAAGVGASCEVPPSDDADRDTGDDTATAEREPQPTASR